MAAGRSNPVHPDYFADPFVWRVDEGWLAVGTGAAEAEGAVRDAPGPTVFPMLRSRDLVRWERAGHALVRPDPSLGDSFWAPEVAWRDGRWYLYYSVGHGDRRHRLRVAAADAPTGPYVDVAGLTEPDRVPFAIDPHPFRDADGRWLLFHARDLLDEVDAQGRPCRVGTSIVVHELPEPTRLEPRGIVVARARADWQRFAADRPMYGRRFDWHTLEGPFVIRREDRYWCLYSGGCWRDASYGVDFACAASALGPWCDDTPDSGPRVLRTVPGAVLGPGHCSVVESPGDGGLWIAYHAWHPPATARRLCLDPLTIGPDGPRSPGPSAGPGGAGRDGGAAPCT